MNKTELIDAIARDADLSKADAEKALNTFISTITENVKNGVKVAIPGLGTFEKITRAARAGINPATKERIQIAAKDAPKFKAAKSFKEFVA